MASAENNTTKDANQTSMISKFKKQNLKLSFLNKSKVELAKQPERMVRFKVFKWIL